jgi:hypothetical protein
VYDQLDGILPFLGREEEKNIQKMNIGLGRAGKLRARVRFGLNTLGSGFFRSWNLYTKIGLRLLLNKIKSQARGPCPKPKPGRAQDFGLFSKSPTQANQRTNILSLFQHSLRFDSVRACNISDTTHKNALVIVIIVKNVLDYCILHRYLY